MEAELYSQRLNNIWYCDFLQDHSVVSLEIVLKETFWKTEEQVLVREDDIEQCALLMSSWNAGFGWIKGFQVGEGGGEWWVEVARQSSAYAHMGSPTKVILKNRLKLMEDIVKKLIHEKFTIFMLVFFIDDGI